MEKPEHTPTAMPPTGGHSVALDHLYSWLATTRDIKLVLKENCFVPAPERRRQRAVRKSLSSSWGKLKLLGRRWQPRAIPCSAEGPGQQQSTEQSHPMPELL